MKICHVGRLDIEGASDVPGNSSSVNSCEHHTCPCICNMMCRSQDLRLRDTYYSNWKLHTSSLMVELRLVGSASHTKTLDTGYV
jgi:hypothetical protein